MAASALRAVVLLLAAVPLHAERFLFRIYGGEQGLSNQAITGILQDKRGYLWVGTENGLNRFDGHRFLSYGTTDGLPDTYITGMEEGPDGTLWVGTIRGWAWKDGARFRTSKIDVLQRIAPNRGVAFGDGGLVYLATARGLATTHRPAAGKDLTLAFIPQPAGTSDSFATSVLAEPNGVVWFGCGKSICRMGSGGIKVFGAAEGVPVARWQYLLRDGTGSLWARSRRQLIELPAGDQRFYDRTLDGIAPCGSTYPSLATDSSGRLFVTTARGLAVRQDGKWRTIGRHQGLPLNDISAFMQDRDGALWVGTTGAGLARWLGYDEWQSFTGLEGLPGDQVISLLGDPSGLWAGTTAGFAFGARKDSTWTWTDLSIPGVEWVRSLVRGPDGAVWLLTDRNTLMRVDPATRRAREMASLPATMSDIHFDRGGRLWLAAYDGVYRAESIAAPLRLERVEAPGRKVFTAIAEAADGEIWISSYDGLARFADGAWSQIGARDGLRARMLEDVSVAPNGDIWAAYVGANGIARLHFQFGRLQITHVDRTNGLATNKIYSARFDRAGNTWLLTDAGAYTYRDHRWVRFAAANGLVWNDCNTRAFWADSNGVWIGTSRGLSHYTPRAGSAPPQPAAPVFTAVRWGSQPISGEFGAALESPQRSLFAAFSALRYAQDAETNYRYRLTGLESGWHETATPEVSFPYLPPGKYRLEAQVRTGANPWSASAVLALRVLPTWHEAWWFRLSLAAAAVAGSMLLVRLWIRRSTLSRGALEAEISRRTEELRVANERLRKQMEVEEALEHQLIQSRKMEAIGRLAGGVAHDFNNLLTVINGYSELIMSQLPDDTDAHANAVLIHSAGERAAELTQQLLAFSRKQVVRPTVVDLNTLLRESEALLRGAVGELIRVELRLAPSLPPVRVEPSQMMQVCMHLAANARDAMPKGGELRVSTSTTAVALSDTLAAQGLAPGAYVTLTMADTGIGMDEETCQRIFDPFFTTKGPGEGGTSGLGLASVYGTIGQFQGHITVESRLGAGSSFHIYLPAVDAPATPPAPASSGEPVKRNLRGAETILLVEDQEQVRRFVTQVLESWGYRVLGAPDGPTALTTAADYVGRIHLLLTDVVMPGMTGAELATRMATERPGLRVLYTSGHTDDVILERGVRSGELAFIRKPFSPEALLEKVRETLSAPYQQDYGGE